MLDSSELMSKPWNLQSNTNSNSSWGVPAAPSSDAAEDSLKMGEKRRLESVFASSPWQPQLMVPLGNKDQDGSQLPAAYQSLPSDASGQITWPVLQTSPASLYPDSFPSASPFPSIDPVISSLQTNAQDNKQGFPHFGRSLESGVLNHQGPENTFKIPSLSSQGFTIQYGGLSASTQGGAAQVQGAGASMPGRPDQYNKIRRQELSNLMPNAFELQEMYHSQSDVLEDILRNSKGRLSNQNAPFLTKDMEAELNGFAGPSFPQPSMQRANSALEPLALPQRSLNSTHASLEPYMPGWSSESVPAELPNHMVNRLQMRGQPHAFAGPIRPGSLSIIGPGAGLSNRHHSLMTGVLQNHQSLGLGDKDCRTPAPASPKADDLEELTRSADAEIAHRAYLVPAHKKRGKGGRQPATDPRLDPNIDERKAKRILANRLSAARSKMKQKTQMEGLGKMVSQLEKHNKACKTDSHELMEACERLEMQNRRLTADLKILEEYHRRLHAAQASRLNARLETHHRIPADIDRMPLIQGTSDLYN